MTTTPRFRLNVFVLCLALLPVSAFAQQPAKSGIVMGVPASLSVIVRLTDSVAVRPEISIAHASTSVNNIDSSQTLVYPGVSVLFYLKQWDGVRTYVSPRYLYKHGSSSSSTPAGQSKSSASSHDVAGSFGAEFAAHERFSVFGEVGLDYTHVPRTGGLSTSSSNGWATRTAVGVILNF